MLSPPFTGGGEGKHPNNAPVLYLLFVRLRLGVLSSTQSSVPVRICYYSTYSSNF